MTEYSLDGISWMTDEMKKQIHKRNKIVNDNDIDGLFLLKDNSDFTIALHEILVNKHDKNRNSLNPIQLNLFLCIHMENAGQADSILSFLQEMFPEHTSQIIISLNEIGAVRSAEIIKQAIKLLPIDNSWFYDNSDEISENLMSRLDSEFSDYPDGSMTSLYRQYAEKNISQI